ncbi:TetR/AcrR family transcriptional regulator [Rapidithrix thailandica]|uniref:TetR/AcrR family transcriptional regulator n=1 Tax=Rapidithrix thailandica TaxID=413964 RepID=A0AAW9S6L7_9BACT
MRTKDASKEQAIREEALEMIVQEGFKGLSMQKLAKKANVSPATIYLYFENRQDLLNQLFMGVQQKVIEASLVGFDPEMPFEEGMKVLWLNRFRYFKEHPAEFFFLEQFVNSPLLSCVNNWDKKKNLVNPLQKFAENAVARNEIEELPFELYWPIGFSPLYQLIKYELHPVLYLGKHFEISEEKLLKALQIVLKGMKKG